MGIHSLWVDFKAIVWDAGVLARNKAVTTTERGTCSLQSRVQASLLLLLWLCFFLCKWVASLYSPEPVRATEVQGNTRQVGLFF